MILKSLIVETTVILLLIAGLISCKPKEEKQLLIPVVSSEFWDIGPEPDLSAQGLQPGLTGDVQPNQPNDHCIFKADDGKWHLWACVRRTKVGRILCHWEADSLTQSPWTFTGEIIRASREAGESLVDWMGQEFIQSPYVVTSEGKYYMFYGGYDSGLDRLGRPTPPQPSYDSVEKQISLMISPDGLEWERHKNDSGYSRVFIGPGAARDINIVKFEDTWYAYYCGHHNMDRTCGAIYVRTSDDLINWSDWTIAQYDKSSEGKRWLPESPAVVKREGWYYLFRTHGPEGGVYVYRSSDPLNFGQGDVSDYFVTRIPGMVACEIFTDQNGNEYISNITDGSKYGIRLAKLKWEKQ
jgi:hypothetical protein